MDKVVNLAFRFIFWSTTFSLFLMLVPAIRFNLFTTLVGLQKGFPLLSGLAQMFIIAIEINTAYFQRVKTHCPKMGRLYGKVTATTHHKKLKLVNSY
jgi:hypothetical protein